MTTAKEFVKERYPDAESSEEKYYSKRIWIVYNDDKTIAKSLKSESNAWVNAKKKIIEQEK